jgi:transglutaminase-like putative cysteine protease
MRMRAIVSLAAAGFFFACGSARASASAPDWVAQAAAVLLPEHSKDAKAIVLLDDTLVTVQADGRATERYRYVVRILRPQGRAYAEPVAWFSKDAKLLSFHVWSIGPDGHQYTMKDNEYREVGAEGGGILYEDDRAKVASPPGADPGGIVAYEAERQIRPYMSEESWTFQETIPIARSVFELDLPGGWNHLAVWFKHDTVQPVEVAPGHFRWELANIPEINLTDVPLAPSERSLAARMVVHYSAQALPEGDALWAKIGNWYDGLAAPRSEGTAEIAAKSRSLAAADADFTVRIQNVAKFLQEEIRYVGIEIGIGGMQPHAATDVYRNRYGDCKDKATLLIAMLDSVGVRATWVLVDTHRGFIDPRVPSVDGNHAIAAIEIPKGYDNPLLKAVVTARTGKRYLIFDPTNPYVSIGLLPEYLQGGYGILVAGSDSQVIELPVLKPDSDVTVRAARFDLAPDGTLKGSVTVTHNGASAWGLREFYAMSSEKEQRTSLEESLRRDFSSFTVGSQSVQHVRDLSQQLSLEYEVEASSYAKSAGPLLLLRTRVVGSDVEELNDKPRKYPIQFRSLGDWKDNFDVQIPADYSVDEVPDPMNVDVGFASYHSEVKVDGKTLHYSREYVLKKISLDPDEYPALKQFETMVNTDENRSAVLKKQ